MTKREALDVLNHVGAKLVVMSIAEKTPRKREVMMEMMEALSVATDALENEIDRAVVRISPEQLARLRRKYNHGGDFEWAK